MPEVEHWHHAASQGAVAARTLLKGPGAAPLDEVPYFWSDQYDVKLQTLGVTADHDAFEIIEDNLDEGQFVGAYGRGGRTVAVLGTIPDRVYAYRDGIKARCEFPPKVPD